MPDMQILRFVVVGVGNTAFSYAIYAVFLFIGFGYAIANLFALLISIVFSFKTQGRFVFNNTDNRRFLRFVIAWTLIYLATIALIGQLIALGLNAYVAGALALPFSTALSFVTQKYFVFKTSTASAEPIGPSHSEKLR